MTPNLRTFTIEAATLAGHDVPAEAVEAALAAYAKHAVYAGDRKAMAAALAAAAPFLRAAVVAWQPIETAPKGPAGKGIYLLGYVPDFGMTPEGCLEIIWWEEGEQAWFAEAYCEKPGCKPTHWQPLPEPPSSLSPTGGAR